MCASISGLFYQKPKKFSSLRHFSDPAWAKTSISFINKCHRMEQQSGAQFMNFGKQEFLRFSPGMHTVLLTHMYMYLHVLAHECNIPIIQLQPQSKTVEWFTLRTQTVKSHFTASLWLEWKLLCKVYYMSKLSPKLKFYDIEQQTTCM